MEYAGPRVSVELLNEFLPPSSALQILDAGCGTGLVGQELISKDYEKIEGFDLSESMASQAQATGAYNKVNGGIDIMRLEESYNAAQYDAILCVGVFTLGHVPPEALKNLISLVKPEGLLVISVRKLYYDESRFQTVLDELISSEQLTQVKRLDNAPYNNDGPGKVPGLAHYWVLRKT